MSILDKLEPKLAELEPKLRDSLAAFEAKAPREDVDALVRLAAQAHDEAASGAAPRHPELAWLSGALGHRKPLKHQLRDESWVNAEGVLIGINRYEDLDPRWSLAMIEYLEHRDAKAPFAATPGHVELAERVKLAIAGDWGTGYWRGDQTPAAKVARVMQSGAPDWTIHLGDVYYAGTSDEEHANLIDVWPRGARGQFVLNSNHEMYSGGGPFFTQAIPTLAPQQQGTSYWSASNEHWFVIGLDTAYEATDIYLDGNLGENTPQTRWLSSLAAAIGSRKVIVLSHHEPVPFDGSSTTTVYQQVTALLGRVPDYWYWGHLHNAIVYRDLPGGFTGRCVGHGAIPYGDAKGLAANAKVAWYETQNADDPEYEQRVLCGFVELELDGPELRERLIGENGEQRWPPPP